MVSNSFFVTLKKKKKKEKRRKATELVLDLQVVFYNNFEEGHVRKRGS